MEEASEDEHRYYRSNDPLDLGAVANASAADIRSISRLAAGPGDVLFVADCLDNLDEKSFIVVRRQLEKDALQLVSISKDLSFRLSDFVFEYAFQDYSFKGDAFQMKNIKPRQDMLLKGEGFADQIKASE